MKICLVNRSYSNKIWDGISTYTHFLAQGLSDSGHEVHIITMARDSNKPSEDNQGKIFIHQIKPLKILFLEKLAELIYGLKVYVKFREIDKKYQIDVVESPDAGAEGFWLAVFYSKKLVIRLHTPSYLVQRQNKVRQNLPMHFLNWMEKYQVKKSALISSPTHHLAKIIAKDYKILLRKIIVIPHPFNLNCSITSQIRNEYLFCIGRIGKDKGIDILIRAFDQVTKKYPQIKVFVAGGIDQNYNHRIMNIPRLINKNIKFLGGVMHDKIFRYIKSSKFVILPAPWENFSYALLESMSLGKAVIVSNAGGNVEIIKDGYNGYLVKPRSPEDLAEKIIYCLGQKEKILNKIGSNAKSSVKKYQCKNILPQIIKFYQKIR